VYKPERAQRRRECFMYTGWKYKTGIHKKIYFQMADGEVLKTDLGLMISKRGK
jgi:hypothetical protein